MRTLSKKISATFAAMRLRTWAVVVLVVGLAWSADAAEFKQMKLPDATEIEYAVAFPVDFRRNEIYPALLVFPGGEQTMDSVRGGLSRYWETEAVKRGYLVFSPAAPAGRHFYEDGADLIPGFLKHLLAEYKIDGDKFHVAGLSNGGVSAFVVAIRYPQMFHSLTALAGFPIERTDFDRLDRLNIKIAMFVGDGDLYWKDGMEKTRSRLLSLGKEVYFEVIPRNGHFLPALSYENSGRIFERIGH